MREQFRRRRLPHWDCPGAIYFVTSCLKDSIPARGLLDLEDYRRQLDRKAQPSDLNDEEWADQKSKLIFARRDYWLDEQPAARHLADERLAAEVVRGMWHFAGERYELWAYVVMPSHFHWVFRPNPAWCEQLGAAADRRTPRERIMHSLKRHTALACNRLLNRQGEFWQDESYDRCLRDEDELERVIAYVEANPVRPGLANHPEQWKFSSAWNPREPGRPRLRPLVGGAGL